MFSKKSSLLGIPKMIFSIEKSLRIENSSGVVIVKKSETPKIFCDFGVLFIVKRRCGCVKTVIKNAKTI